MQESVDRGMTNKAPSYPRAQCVSMELILSKHDNNIAPTLISLKIESQAWQHNAPISVILQLQGKQFYVSHRFTFYASYQ